MQIPDHSATGDEPVPLPPKKRRHGSRFVIGFAVLVIGLGVGWLLREEIIGAPIDPGTPAPASSALAPDEMAFYEGVAPVLRSLAAECQALTELGQAHSRNLVELQRRGDRAGGYGDDIDAFLRLHAVPPRFEPAIARYQAGVAAARRAMSDSRAAFTRFDWDAVARAVTLMDLATQNLKRAVTELETAAGSSGGATPRSS